MKPLHLLLATAACAVVTGCSSADDASGPSSTGGPTSTVTVGLDSSASTSTTVDDTRTSTPASAGTATTTSSTTVVSTIGPGPDVTIDDAVEREGLDALLLNATDLGPDFVESDVSLPAGATPCGFSVDVQFPAEQRGTVLQSSASGASVYEELRFYPNTRVATEAYDAVVAGLTCAGNDQFVLGAVIDVSFELDAEAISVTYTSAEVEGVIIVAELAEVLVGLQFQWPPDAASAPAAPDPLALARIAVQRVVAYSEA